jgi:hypothetical protein
MPSNGRPLEEEEEEVWAPDGVVKLPQETSKASEMRNTVS